MILSWRDHENWVFSDFLVLVAWAVTHYIAAISLYPVQERTANADMPLSWFLWAFAAVALIDIFQTFIRGDLFEPWYYMPFVLHYAILSVIGAMLDSERLHKVIGCGS